MRSCFVTPESHPGKGHLNAAGRRAGRRDPERHAGSAPRKVRRDLQAARRQACLDHHHGRARGLLALFAARRVVQVRRLGRGGLGRGGLGRGGLGRGRLRHRRPDSRRVGLFAQPAAARHRALAARAAERLACSVRRHRLLAASSYPMSVSMDTFCCLCAVAEDSYMEVSIRRVHDRILLHAAAACCKTMIN